jgi:hypothetical protein
MVVLISDGLSICGGNAFTCQVIIARGKGQERAEHIYRSEIDIVKVCCPARKRPTKVRILDVRKRRYKVNGTDRISCTDDSYLISRRTCVTLIE